MSGFGDPGGGNVVLETQAFLGPSTYSVQDSEVEHVLLSRIVNGSSNAPHKDVDEYVYYDSGLNISARIAGRKTHGRKNIRYNVQPRAARGNIPVAPSGCLRLDGSVKLSDVHQRDIMDAARKNAALPSTFARADLLGVVERLASGMAHFATWGGLSANELRGGASLNIRGIMAATENVAIDPASVFITKKTSDRLYPAAFCALACAVCGEGGTVYSDLVTIDGNGVVQFRAYRDAQLASGCYEALNMIGQMYVDANAGPSFALAVTRGCYKIRSLVAHSDEGGYVRNVLRRGFYNAPYGGILLSSSTTKYTGLPTPGGSLESFQRLVDSVLLGAGAAVAIADPMVDINGKAYPTTLTLYSKSPEDPGVVSGKAVHANERLAMQNMWANAAREWAVNYTYLLGVLFCAPGDTSRAIEVVTACADDCIGLADSHLDHRVVVPFFYVEPTSIWPKWIPSMRTMREECGPLAVEGSERHLPPFSGLVNAHTVSAGSYVVDVDFRFMRRHPILVYCEQHARDGMAHIQLFSGTVNKFANVGGTGALAARILAGESLDKFVWGRLHSQVIGIGEVINLDGTVRFKIDSETAGLANAAWNHQINNVPAVHELQESVVYRTARPVYGGVGPLVADDRKWSRSRTAAAQALWSAHNQTPTSNGMGVQVRPTLGEPVPFISSSGVDVDVARLGGAEFEYTGFTDVIEVEPAGPSKAVVTSADVNGNMVPIVIHNVADRGRKAARAGAANVGSGPPPPNSPGGGGPPGGSGPPGGNPPGGSGGGSGAGGGGPATPAPPNIGGGP